MSFLERLFDAQLSIFGQQILWREIVGNAFYQTAVLFAIYGGLVIYGFLVWLKAPRTESPDRELNEVLA